MTDLTMMATKLWRMLRARAKVVNPVEAAELDPMPLEAMSETKARAPEKEGLMEPERRCIPLNAHFTDYACLGLS
jgi:hypothetical protein